MARWLRPDRWRLMVLRTMLSAISRSLRFSGWEARTNISNASSGPQPWAPMKMPLACSVVAREDIAFLSCSPSSIGQPSQAVGCVGPQPAVHGLAHHAVAPVEHFEHRLVSLFHQPQLHEHGRPPSDLWAQNDHSEEGGNRRVVDPPQDEECRAGTGAASEKCQAGTGATVSTMYLDRTQLVGTLPASSRPEPPLRLPSADGASS